MNAFNSPDPLDTERTAWIEPHLTVLGALYIACGLLSLLASVAIFVVMPVTGVNVGDPVARGVLVPLGLAITLFLLALAVACVIGGVGLLWRRPWARLLVLVLGGVNLINVPFGTLLGVYSIVILAQEAAAHRLTPASLPRPISERSMRGPVGR